MPRFQLNRYQRLTQGLLDIRRLDIYLLKSVYQARLGSYYIALIVYTRYCSRIYKRVIRAYYRKLRVGFLPLYAQMIYFILALYFLSSDLKFCCSIIVLTALSPIRLFLCSLIALSPIRLYLCSLIILSPIRLFLYSLITLSPVRLFYTLLLL